MGCARGSCASDRRDGGARCGGWRSLTGARLAAHPFAHGAVHALPDGRQLVDSYHCSRYNTNTGRLTAEMFRDVFRIALALKDQTSGPNSSTSPR